MSDTIGDRTQFKQIEIDRLPLTGTVAVENPGLLHDVNATLDMAARDCLLHIRAYAMGHENKEKVVRYPTTWWDAVKLRWAPAWALRRWPAKETVVTFNSRYVLTECPWAPPPNGGPIRIVYQDVETMREMFDRG